MINVLIIDLGRDYGGAEKVIENLFFYDYSDINMHLVALKDTKFFNVIKSKNNNQNCMFIENDKKKILKSLFKVKKYIEDNKIDIIHAHGVTSEIFGVLLSKMTKCNLVTTIHSRADFDTTNKVKGKTYCFIQKILLRYNKKYIVVSDSLNKFFISDMNADSTKIDTIVNGIKPLEKREKKLNDIFTISTVGRLTPVKSHKKLIEALIELKKEDIKFKCIIAGNGELEEELKKLVDTNDMKNEIKFYGFVKDVRDVLDESNCLIIHSDMEGLPITLLEAMSYNVPIITHQVGGINGVINEKNGIIMKKNNPDEIKDKIKFCMQNEKEANLRAKKAEIDFMNKYDISKFIKSYCELYENLQ